MQQLFTKGIIVVWMGRLPSYFPLWIRSLQINDSFDFLLFTDQLIETKTPDNLKIVRLSFRELKDVISEKLSIRADIPHPYKLCDFKPAYGEIFSDYLGDYDFWGCCDIDLLFGDLKVFVTDDLLRSYRKIFSRGHLTLYKNEPAINSAYRRSKLMDYQKILQSPDYCLFDEWHGIHRIFDELGIGQYNKELMADIKVSSARVVCNNIVNFKKQIFVWQEGVVNQYFLTDGQLDVIELAYVHFQKRKIVLSDPAVFSSKVIILNPQSLLPFNGPITADTVIRYDRPDYNHFVTSQLQRIKKKFFLFKKDAVVINKSVIPVRVGEAE
jgi:hypothetical protein